MSKKREQNFGLTEEEFTYLLQELKNGNERLFKKVILAQVEGSIQYLIHRYKVSRQWAYDATVEGLLNFRKQLLEGKIVYGNTYFLFHQMVRQFLTDSLNEKTAKSEEDREFEDDLDTLDTAWKELDENCKELLEDFYYKKIPLKELSKVFGKSEAAMRKQKQRCLEKLRSYF